MHRILSQEERNLEVKKLLYHSWHRGCKETDLLLGRFAQLHLNNLTDDELLAYKSFLDEDDWDIFNWLTEKAPLPEKHHNSMMDKLLHFKFSESL